MQNTRGQGTQTSGRPCVNTPMLVQQRVHIAVAVRLGFYNAVLACARAGTNVKACRYTQTPNVKAPAARCCSTRRCAAAPHPSDTTRTLTDSLRLVRRAPRSLFVSLCQGSSALLLTAVGRRRPRSRRRRWWQQEALDLQNAPGHRPWLAPCSASSSLSAPPPCRNSADFASASARSVARKEKRAT